MMKDVEFAQFRENKREKALTCREYWDMAKKLKFIYLEWETYGDRRYYYCEEDGVIYNTYESIGD